MNGSRFLIIIFDTFSERGTFYYRLLHRTFKFYSSSKGSIQRCQIYEPDEMSSGSTCQVFAQIVHSGTHLTSITDCKQLIFLCKWCKSFFYYYYFINFSEHSELSTHRTCCHQLTLTVDIISSHNNFDNSGLLFPPL